MPTISDNERAFLASALGLTDTQAAKMTLADLRNSFYSGGTGGLVTPSQLTAAVAPKADTTTVNTALATKADTTTVNAALATKADTTTVNTALATKADQASVTTALGLKADLATISAVNGEQYLVANGTTDDTAALNTMFAAGTVIVMPKNKTIRVTSKVTIPAGKVVYMNGCTITATTNFNDFLMQVGSNTTIVGVLKGTLPGGVCRGFEVTGTNINIEAIDVSATSTAGAGQLQQNALNVRDGSFITIGRISINKFDYPIQFLRLTNFHVQHIQILEYVRGIYISDVKYAHILGGRCATASPNAAVTPGHNGILIDAATANASTTDIQIDNFVVADAGEHSFRIGGSFTVKRVAFNNCTSLNNGGCGFKVLGDSVNKHEEIVFNTCVVEDAAQDGTNGAGFMLQYVRRNKAIGCIVRKNTKTYAASEGFNIQGAEFTTVVDADVEGVKNYTFALINNLGNQTGVRIWGGRFTQTEGYIFFIDYGGVTFRRVTIEGWPQCEASGTAFILRIQGSATAGTIVGACFVSWASVSANTVQVDTTNSPAASLTPFTADIRATFPAVNIPIFRNGSLWIDTTRRTVSGGAWV